MLLLDEPVPDEGLLDEPVAPLLVPGGFVMSPPVEGWLGAPVAPLPLPLVSVPGLLVVEPPDEPLVPIPLLPLPDVPGVPVLSPSPAPVPVVPVWLGLVSIGGSAVGELVGLAPLPLVSPGVVVPLPVELGLGDAP